MILLLLTFILAFHVLEAMYEAKAGDALHYPSFLGQFFISVLLGWLLPSVSIAGGIIAFIAVRIWFDYLYNYFKGTHWSYVGTVAKTDQFIRLLEKRYGGVRVAYTLLLVRLLVSVGSIMLITKI